MDRYPIRFATVEDIPGIMSFINQYWKAGHVLGTSRSFFEYEHQAEDNRVNFALAFDRKTKELLCICGFLQSCRDITKGCAWEVVWMKKPGAPRGIGVAVMDYIPANCGAKYDFIVGANPGTIPLHIERGYVVGKLRHYYRLNADKKSYGVADISNRRIPEYDTSASVKLVPVSAGAALEAIVENAQQLPRKDYWYICKRYLRHPVYNYNLWALQHADGSADSVMITRTVHTDRGSALRIVDYIGPHADLCFAGSEIDRLMQESGLEYTDLYCYGVEDAALRRAGLIERTVDDANIIPNYFEPFAQKNIDIQFISSLKDGFCIFKGDADQDRPNRIRE